MATSPSDSYDVLVVGAGPAGLAAAAAASNAGVRVVVVDAAQRPGGQYWRQAGGPGVEARLAGLHLHHELATFERLVAGLDRCTVLAGHWVWAITRDEQGVIAHLVERSDGTETAREVRARKVVLAPGAYDRQIPFPGWDLPGVMTAGGAQALLKGHGVAAGPRVLVAGTGPFLLPVAAGLAEAGARVIGIHEANAVRNWLRHPGTMLRNAAKLTEGVGYARALARHRVSVHSRSTVIEAHGGDQLEAVTLAKVDSDGQVVPGSEHRIAVDVLAVGWGFTPQLELPLALGCATHLDVDGSHVVTVDDHQRTTIDGVWVAGEACGIGGVALSVVEGAVAGASAAGVAPERASLRQRKALRQFAIAMHRTHPVPSGWLARVTSDTLVCRCEEVTAGDLHAAVDDLGADSARSAKLLARVGLGWCQGRVCGYAASCLIADRAGAEPSIPMANRPIASPITLGALAEVESRDG